MGKIDLNPRHVGVGTFRSNHLMYDYLTKILDTGRISYGPFSKEFEQTFAALHDCQYAILSNSGTSALQVALHALKEYYSWADGDEVIVPATTFVATANIVIHNQLTPVFVDVEMLTYGIDAKLIPEKITERTRAIIPVHLFGQPCMMYDVLMVATQHNLRVIEDSAETMFAKHNGKSVGSMGDIGCFSTYVAHLLVTGVGGISTTNNPDLAGIMRSLVNHGLELENLNPGENFSPRPALGRRFRFDRAGYSYRVTEMEAALGIAQLVTIQQDLRIRRRNARHLSAGLQRLNRDYGEHFKIPRRWENNDHSWMMYPIVLLELDKRSCTDYLNEHQIETRDMLPILGQPTYAYLDSRQYPNSAQILESGFYVGCHQHLEREDIDYVLQTLEELLQ